MSEKKRIPTDAPDFSHNPFGELSSAGLPPGPAEIVEPIVAKKKSRGRVDILRSTAHRGGKTVTVVKNFVGIGLPEKEQLAKKMQKACGTGGTAMSSTNGVGRSAPCTRYNVGETRRGKRRKASNSSGASAM